MIQTNYGGQTVFLVNELPNFGKGYQVEFVSDLDQQASLTNRESRRAWAMAVQFTLKTSSVICGVALRVLQGQLRQLKAQPVVIPFWPAASFWSDRASMKISGGLLIAFKRDWSQFSIYLPGAEPGWPLPGDQVAPLAWGYLKRTDLRWINGTSAEWPVEFIEDGPAAYALTLAPGVAAPAGPTPAGYGVAPTILPFRPSHQDVTERLSVNIGKDQVGFAREQSATFYPHEVYRGQVSKYVVKGAVNVSLLLAWFNSLPGQGASFWAASSLAVGNLSVAALAGDTALNLVDVSALQVGDWLCAFNGVTFAYAQVQTIVGNVVNLVAAVGIALTLAHNIYPLCLAKLDSPKVTIDFGSPIVASASISWSEVKPEAALPAFETLGVTIGQLAVRATLFQFTRDYGNGTVDNFYFTGYEQDLAYGGQNYIHGPWSCGDITSSLNLEADSCDIESMLTKPDGTLYTASPLVVDIILGSEFPLTVKVTFVDVASNLTASNAQLIFSGDCVNFSRKGNGVVAHCGLGSSVFDTELPLFIKGVMCNHLKGSPGNGTHLISQGCTGPDAVMLKASWKFTANVANVISSAYPYTLNLSTLAGVGASAIAALAVPRVFSNWFAFGTVEWGAGNAIQRRLVVGSTLPIAGAISLSLHRYFSAVPALGNQVTIYPGCDGMFATCKPYNAASNPTGKFGNQLNFSGDPFSPIGNPTFTGLPTLGVQGAKK